MEQKLLTPGPLLDENGDLVEAGYANSLVKTYDRKAIKAGKYRIKEWDYYYIGNADYGLALTIADNSYMSLVSASVLTFGAPCFERTSSDMAWFTKGKLGLPSTSKEGDLVYENKKNGISFAFKHENGKRRLIGTWDKFGKDGELLRFDVTLEETSFHKYEPSDWSNHGTKSYNFCRFTLKENGKQFCLINTHLWWKGENTQPGSDEARTAQVRKMMTAVDDAVFAHGCPVFMMGDMNCNLSSKAMKQLLEAGYKPLVWEATVYGDPRSGHQPCNASGFSRTENKSSENGMGAIDQFFVYNGKGGIWGASDAEILVFQRIYAYFTIELTDHYPNYADIRLQ